MSQTYGHFDDANRECEWLPAHWKSVQVKRRFRGKEQTIELRR